MNWLDMSLEQVGAVLKEWGEPAFRAKQVFSWLHKGAWPSEMKNIPKPLRERMEGIALGGAEIREKVVSKQTGTAKYLFAMQDGQMVEGVLMQYKHGKTLCISTQVGCRMGCNFCASTIGGLVRNLSPGEMLGQVLAIEREQRALGQVEKDARAVTNVVLMGSGEPMDNYENVLAFLSLINSKEGINISLRNISLSTCGLPEKIRALADDLPGVTLCISLHAPNDTLRRTMMPIANRVSLAELLEAVRYFVKTTGRRIILEYALVREVNDSEKEAAELAGLLRGLQCHVNLIPLNEVKERPYYTTTVENAGRFLSELTKRGISATIRRELGDDIDGACGQLRNRYLQAME